MHMLIGSCYNHLYYENKDKLVIGTMSLTNIERDRQKQTDRQQELTQSKQANTNKIQKTDI